MTTFSFDYQEDKDWCFQRITRNSRSFSLCTNFIVMWGLMVVFFPLQCIRSTFTPRFYNAVVQYCEFCLVNISITCISVEEKGPLIVRNNPSFSQLLWYNERVSHSTQGWIIFHRNLCRSIRQPLKSDENTISHDDMSSVKTSMAKKEIFLSITAWKKNNNIFPELSFTRLYQKHLLAILTTLKTVQFNKKRATIK